MAISINSLKELEDFAGRLAAELVCPPYPVIMLDGPLGAGKTALARCLVNKLPGTELCEVSSPTFNFCNIYPTSPPVTHFDLYRCKNAIPEELLEQLEREDALTLIEWSSYLPYSLRPENWLDIHFILDKNTRRLNLYGAGSGLPIVKLFH